MRSKSVFKCSECGYSNGKWFGKCPECDSWEIEEAEISGKNENALNSKKSILNEQRFQPLTEIILEAEFKYQSAYPEFDRVLGSGLVKGSVSLISGSPGIGKSTLLLQILSSYAELGSVLYVSGEESIYQIRQRSIRLNIHNVNLHVLAETEIELIENAIFILKPKVVIIDSIQTILTDSIGSVSGSTSQIKEACTRFIRIAKTQGIPFLIVGHVTKDGKIAGPKLLEHMVDTVLNFEGESENDYRMIRTTKNRYGATNELAIFEMSESGMNEVKNISEYFLGEREKENQGSVATTTLNGNRVFLLELQTLVSKSVFGLPRRVAQGVDFNKFQLIVAILEKTMKLQLMDKDIFINIPGGLLVKEPAIDLAMAVSIYSSLTGNSIMGSSAFVGEIGLRGEIRKVSYCLKRAIELEKCGFSKIFVPKGNEKELLMQKLSLEVVAVNRLEEVFKNIKFGR
ncbi:MAG: DNA repair protein RadA [Fusobacteria bacterium]|nr:DNA repair protein RadA [Fusobacteriota bacterium]